MSLSDSEPVDQLSLALDATADLIAGVRDDQWTAATPCTAWTVRDVVEHLILGQYRFASILRGERPPDSEHVLVPGQPATSLYRQSGQTLLDAFRQPGVLQGVFNVPLGRVPGSVALHLRITEALVHGWDIARATGQAGNAPEHLAEQELAFSRAKLPDVASDRAPFGPPQPVDDDAPAIERLAALLGRSLAFSAHAATPRA